MDFPLKSMFDAFKDEIWEELGPLDPNWFETLTSNQFLSEENVSDQDDLCPNQEGHFKAPFGKDAVDSQLVSTPKVFRHRRIVSPGTEDEQSFNTNSEREAPPWAETQSPYLSEESKERFQGVKLCDLQYQSQDIFKLHNTPHKSDVSFAKHISEALGADTHTDVSWTSSLNTPTASTLILTKHDRSPRPVSVSEEQNVVIVRKLFPSLASEDLASGVGFLSPEKNCATPHQDAVACKSEDTLESPDCSQVSLNQNKFIWRQKLPDAIDDGDNTIASAIDGAEDILSIFFTNTNSALRKAKTDKLKRKQKVVAQEGDPKVTVTSPTNTALSAELGPTCQERLSSPPSPNTKDVGDFQWSPLSLSGIPLSAAHNSAASQTVNGSKTPRKLERSLLKVPFYASGKRKRTFVYSVEIPKVQWQGKDTLKVESSSRIPKSGQSNKSDRLPDQADASTSRNDAAPSESQTEKEQHLPEPGKVQDLNISQLSRDFAQDFSQIIGPNKVEALAQDTSCTGFSPSACLSAMKQAYSKTRQTNPHPQRSRSPTNTNPTTLMNESSILDSGFQSIVTDVGHVTLPCTTLEGIGQSLHLSDFKMDDSGITASLSLNKRAGDEHQDCLLQKVTAEARLPAVVTETEFKTNNKECEQLGENQSAQLLGSPKEKAGKGTDEPEKPTVPSFSAFTSGFKTASHKEIPVSSVGLTKAGHLFEGTETEYALVHTTIECAEDKLEVTGDSSNTVTCLPTLADNIVNGFQLTASQKADVTALCTVLEEADSQFEFTQFRVAKSKQPNGATFTTEPENELDCDFLAGVDFDDSFSLDLGKNQTKSQRNGDAKLKPNGLKCEKATESKTGNLCDGTTNVSQNGNDGFKTAGGNVLRVSREHLSRAKALFADLVGGFVSTPENCDKTTEKSSSKGIVMCKSGLQTANGKATSMSAKNNKANGTTGNKHELCHKYQNVEEIKLKFAQGATTPFENCSAGPSYKSSSNAINRDNASIVNESITKAENPVGFRGKHIPQQAPEHAGFFLANGKGVSVSSEALRKAEILPSDCDQVKDEDISRQAPREWLTSETPPMNGGFLAASGKPLTISHQALKQAKALFSDISLTTEIRPTSLITNGSKQQDVAETAEKIPGGFVDGVTPLKAQSLSNGSSIGAENVHGTVERSSAPSLKANQFAMEDGPPLCTLPDNIGHQAVGELSDRGFTTAACEKRASLSDEAMKEAKGSLFSDGTSESTNRETDLCPPQKVGFQTASGKGVIISSAALKKAKILLNECEGAEEKGVLKDSHFRQQIPDPALKGRRLTAATERRVKFPKACQDAGAYPAGRSSKSESTVVSNSWTTGDKEGSTDQGMLSSGFTTAGGARVHVLQKNLLKAKRLLNDFHLEPKCNDVVGSTLEQHSNPGNYATTSPPKESQSLTEELTGSSSVNETSGRTSTVTGSGIAVSSKATAKAKAVLSSDGPFKGRCERAKEMDTFLPQSDGFQTASGKGVTISTAALKTAKALLSDCEEAQKEGCGKASQFKKPAPIPNSKTSNPNKDLVTGGSACGFTTARGAKVHVSQINLLKAKKLLSERNLEGIDSDSSSEEQAVIARPKFRQQQVEGHGAVFRKTNGDVSTNEESGFNQNPVRLEERSENGDFPSINASGFGGELNMANGKRVSGSTEALAEAKKLPNLEVTNGFLPQKVGFQTASGKGVAISLAALQKAKLLLSECEGVTEEVGDEDSPFQEAHLDPAVKLGRPSEAATKLVVLSEGLGVTTENKDPFGDSDKMHCSFTTAGGAKVLVSQKSLLKAKTLLSECNPVVPDAASSPSSSSAAAGLALQQQQQLLKKKSENKEFPSVGGSGFGSGFNTASGKKVSVAVEAITEAKKLLNSGVTNGFSAQTGGFQTASGKGVTVSSAALQKAKLLFSECEGGKEEERGRESQFEEPHPRPAVRNSGHPAAAHNLVGFSAGRKVESKDSDSDKMRCGFRTAGGAKVLVSQKSLLKAQNLLSECKPAVTANGSSSNKSDVTTSWIVQQQQLMDEKSENIDFPSISASDSGGEFNTASKKKVPVSMEMMAKARNRMNSGVENGFTPQTGGFQTASGKGVAISPAALQKAKLLLCECEGEKEEQGDRNSPFKKPNPGQTGKNCDLQSFLQGLAVTTKNRVPFIGSDKIRCGYTTAGGAEVLVSLRTSEAGGTLPTLTETENPVQGNLQTPNERTMGIKNSKIRNDSPPGVSQLSDSLEEEMLSVLEYEMNQLGDGEAAAEVEEPVQTTAVHLQSLDFNGCTETQQQFLAQEAMDCTKALLEDEHLAGRRTSVTLERSTYMHDHPESGSDAAKERKGTGKRMAEDSGENSQPPLKRRLLEEFDRTVVGRRGAALEPEITSPNGIMKDRRAFRYSLSIQPNITGPHRNRAKCFESNSPQTTATRRSGPADGKTAPSKAAVFVPPLCKSTSKETCQSGIAKDGAKTPAVFIPPFKKQRVVVQDSYQEPKRQKMEEENKYDCVSVTPVKSFLPPAEKSPSNNDAPGCKSKEGIQSAASADTSRNEPQISQKLPVGLHPQDPAGETCLFLANVELARGMQDMRIRKKKRQTIRPLPGKLFLTKASAATRIPLKAAGARGTPARYTTQQLYSHGVHQRAHEITGETAEAFRFSLKQFVKPEALMEAGGIQLADGGWLIPSEDGTAGKEEFYRSLCDTPGVDPKLISEEWVHNHYRWIVWKQASMEKSFPETMGGRCLTPHQVLLQLKYRYDVEVDHSRRPALRKIMERDDTAAKTLVLCVCGVASRGSTPKAKTPGGDATVDGPFAVVWLTDGWYAIKAQLDEPLTAMLLRGRLTVGGKLITHGAQLVGSQDACSPLEAPTSLMLKICANSSRPARWDSKLGFHRDPRPFLLPISSLYSSGGPVGCVDVVILRSYPLQWMERKPDGGVMFRCARTEEREERRYNAAKQKAMETLFTKIQSDFEKKDKEKNNHKRRRRTVCRQDIASLQDGEELYEALGDDPAYLEAHLSVQQMEALHAHRRTLVEKNQAEVQERYRRALEEAQDGEGGCPRRDVAPVWRLCVADSTQQPGSVYQMSLWRPPSDLQSLLKEGCRYKVFNLTTSEAKKPGGSTTVQLTGTKKTQFEHLQVTHDWLSSRYQPRVSTDFVTLQKPDFQPLCGEIDLAGYVISVIDAQGPSPAFYLADGRLNFVKVRCFNSFAQSGLEDVVRPRALLALGNLQLRGQSMVPTPVVYAGDLTVFSTNPKEAHLQESLSQLRNLVQSQDNFVAIAEEKLSCLKSDGLSSIPSPALQAGTPASSKKVAFHQSVRNLGPSTPIGQKPLETNSSAEKNPSTLKRRKALDYLSRIPAPPQLSPLNSTVSPCVKKTFVPPRRSGTPCTLKPAQILTPKPVNPPAEEEWVNDEELAMIDTQALHVGSTVCSHGAAP